MPKTCLYCHADLNPETHKPTNRVFCNHKCSYNYGRLKQKIVDLYAFNDSKKYADEIILLMKLGKDYKFGGIEND
jgi:hypothetical protein